jgi:CDP-glucose 4,6-dehydratase
VEEVVAIDIFKNLYKSKKILVTGDTGFKGSWLSIWLHQLGANVIGYALDPYTERDNFVLSKLDQKIIDIRGDVRDIENLKLVFKKYQPEIVFHLAAQPLVRLSYELPRDTLEQNIMGTVNILECVRQFDCVSVCVVITSDKCYENKERLWGYREDEPLGGRDPYSVSKACAELVTNAYIRSFFQNMTRKGIATVRAGNVLGGGDWSKDRIIPDCIRALEENRPIEIRNPGAVRPWQHVLEPLSGYLWLAANLLQDPVKYMGAWNFGPDMDSLVTVKDVVEKLLSIYGKGKWHDVSDSNSAHEANMLALDCSKAFYQLRWKPSLTLDSCLSLTVEWYKKYVEHDVYDICTSQISDYIEQAKQRKNVWAS